MNTPKRKGTRAELVAELAGLSLRRVRRMVNGKPIMVTLIDLPDEYPEPIGVAVGTGLVGGEQ